MKPSENQTFSNTALISSRSKSYLREKPSLSLMPSSTMERNASSPWVCLTGALWSSYTRRQTTSFDSYRQERQPAMKRSATSKKSRTDWARVDAMKDEDIDLSESPEIPPEMFARAVVRKGLKPVPRKEQLTLRIDSD